MTAATAPSQSAMKRLAGALAFVCMVLFLLAIEQKHAVAAWETVRDEAAPAARRVADWAGGLPSGVAGGVEGLRSAVARQTGSWRASPAAAVPKGERGPAGQGASAGSLTLVGAELRFGDGGTLRTRPLRIAYGRDAFAPGQTFAARLNVAADAQIELRQIVPPLRGQAAAPPRLCGGEPAAAAALLHRRDRIELMLFRTPTVGPDTPPSALCGVWSFPAR